MFRYSIILSLILAAHGAFAEGLEAEKARGQLVREIALLEQIDHDVERADLPRTHLLKNYCQTTLTLIDRNGMGNTVTMRAYQNLVLSFRYSHDLFTQIQTVKTKTAITELLSIQDQISRDRGFDAAPLTEITKDVFTQIHQILMEIRNVDLPESLQHSLSSLQVPVGELIAVASLGDGLKTLTAAMPVYQKIRELYSQLDQVSSSNAGFEMILDLQGLMEFYAQFAQINSMPGGRS